MLATLSNPFLKPIIRFPFSLPPFPLNGSHLSPAQSWPWAPRRPFQKLNPQASRSSRPISKVNKVNGHPTRRLLQLGGQQQLHHGSLPARRLLAAVLQGTSASEKWQEVTEQQPAPAFAQQKLATQQLPQQQQPPPLSLPLPRPLLKRKHGPPWKRARSGENGPAAKARFQSPRPNREL